MTPRPVLRRLLLLRAAVERAARLGHVEEDFWRGEALAVLRLELAGKRHEALRAHAVDVGEPPARVGREAEAEDRADVGLARVGDDALAVDPRRLERLRHEEALLELLHVDAVGIELGGGEVLETGPQALLPLLGVVVEASSVFPSEPAML